MQHKRLVIDANILIRAVFGQRDERDWPGLAAALLMNCPIWTEDQDFFGAGIPTWTTAIVET
ncbi:MAG: PIN domain-containing protein [Thauera sp.]